VLKNESGIWCYGLGYEWKLWDEPTFDEDGCNSRINAEDGLLPTGAQTWRWANGGVFRDRTLTTRLLLADALAAKAAAACEQLSVGMVLEGHAVAAYNGAYRRVSEHEGWPVLKNESGRWCFMHIGIVESWCLGTEPSHHYGVCSSRIVAENALLPIGGQMWKSWFCSTGT
jgi:hypothetical protein